MSGMTDHLDILGDPQPVRHPRHGGHLQVLATAVAATLVLMTGVAYAGYSALKPSGHAPEEALPADTVAFAKVDLDPSASQKVAVYRLSRRFPQTHVRSQGSVRDDLLAQVFKAAGETVDFRRDIKPWIGDRAAIGAVPGTDGPHPMIAVQFHDKAKAKKGVEHLISLDTSDELFYAFSDVSDYVILSDQQSSADAAAHATRHLADDPSYRKAMSALHGDQIVSAWADLGKAFALLSKDQLQDNPLFKVKDLKVAGQYVMGAHAENDAIELDVHELGVSTGVAAVDSLRLGEGTGSDLVQTFPKDALVAASITGLGDQAAKIYDQVKPVITDAGGQDFLATVAQAGLRLPADLKTVLGDEVAGYLTGTSDDPYVLLHVKTADAAAAKQVLQRLVAFIGRQTHDPAPADFLDRVYGTAPDGYVIGVPKLAGTGGGGLGSSSVFRNAVPDAHGAPVVVFVNIHQLISAFDLADGTGAVGKLDAFGLTEKVAGDDVSMRARLTFR